MQATRRTIEFANRVGRWSAERPALEIMLFTLLLVLGIGFVDYITGKDITLSVVYVVPISIAAWFVGPLYAVGLAVLSVVIWLYGDYGAGQPAHNLFIPAWNGTIRLAFYVFLIGLLDRLNSLQRGLEMRVEERAVELTREIAERERLERDLLAVSEREQRRIGQDLHDGLCQHLTGTALAAHVLAERLEARGLSESKDTQRIVCYVEEAITLARGMAKGLDPVDMEADGLMQALDEYSANTSEMFGIQCRFECDSPVLVRSSQVARNLFRIVQEAVSNAIKHGGATEIVTSLDISESGVRLTISDNGHGIPEVSHRKTGMGLRIMADRAKVLGASLSVSSGTMGGTDVVLALPTLDAPADTFHA